MIDATETPAHVRLGRNTALSAVAIALLGISRLLYNVVAGRRFGPEALGQVTLAINAAMFATLLVSGGWQASTARYLSQSIGAGKPREAAWIFRRTLVHNTAGGVVVAAGCWAVLATAPGIDLPFRDAALAGAIAFAYNAYQHLKSASYGFGRVGGYLRTETIASAVLLAGLAAVAIADSRQALLVPVIVAYAIFSVWTMQSLRTDAAEPSPPPAGHWREIKGLTALAIAGTIASAGFLNLAPFFAARYDTPAQLGRFSAALALVLPIYFLPRALSLALFPSISFRYGQQRIDDVKRQLEQAGRGVAIVLLLPCAIGAVLARPMLSIVFGDEFAGGGGVLAILIGATYLSVIQIPFVTALSGTERRWYKIPVIASAIGFAVGIGLWVWLGGRYGAAGIAWGYLAGSVPQALIPMFFAAKVFGVRIAALLVQLATIWLFASLAWSVGGEWAWRTVYALALIVVGFVYLFGREFVRLVGSRRRPA